MTKIFRVNEAARELGVSEAWLRRTEGRVGVPKARRDLNGWRVYTGEDLAALRAVLLPTAPDEGRHDRGGGREEEEG
jgi:DNA-binding transcriptional MerR regulator